MGLMGLLGLTACDKIAPDEYTVYAGPAVEWTDGTAFTPVQHAYVEKYTGPKCPNCPAADLTLDAAHHQFGDNLVLVSINHPKGQGEPFPNQPDMRTDAGSAWDTYFGINAIPAAFLNRRTATQYSGSMNNITSDISSVLNESPIVGVEVSAAGANGTLEITANIAFAQNYTNPLTLTIAVTEDSLAYRQINGTEYVDDYVHNHMLRDVVTDVWGADIDCSGTAGEARKTTINYTLPAGVVASNCNIVAFVSDKQSREVLNSASCRIEE